MNSKKVTIYEVGPRDGLQNESRPVSAEAKIRYIEMLADAGLNHIEASSFVRPGAIPQLSDAAEVFAGLAARGNVADNVRLIALTPNRRGMENALAAGAREAAVFTAASESFTKKNINSTIDESFARFADVMELAREMKLPVRGYVSTVVECPYEGRVNPEKVREVTQRLFDAGVYQVSLGETIGVATPDDISRLLDVLLKDLPADQLAGHFHDTRGTALANVYRAMEFGLRIFDASSGGLGGCPYAPGAAGNLATEDLVYALHRDGYETGTVLEKIATATEFMLTEIGRPATSKAYLAVQSKLRKAEA